MGRNPDFHPAAQADQQHQFEYLQAARDDPDTLRKFVAALKKAKARIRDNPKTWSFAPGSKTVRKVQIPEFRLQMF